tara:strand:+ start:1329 stop:1928 length:600 start_codon:yes stop_codon:yes gene_type:complete
MVKIGITGGIGVGKSYVANILEKMGFPVFYSDQVAKELTSSNLKLIDLIKKEFGDDIYISDNIIDNKRLSSLAFNDNKILKNLNSLIHPFVLNNFNTWCKNQNSKIVFKEAAILFESKSNIDLDRIICISASIKIRIDRIIKRDGRSEDEIMQIISRQMDQKEKEKLSDYVLYNDGQKSIILQLTEILNKLEKVFYYEE